MNPDFPTQIDLLQSDTLASLKLFAPELALCGTIVLLLVVRIMFGRRLSTSLLAFLGSGAALALAVVQTWNGIERQEIFTGMLVFDQFAVFMRIFLLSFLVLFVLMTARTGIPDREDAPDFYTLALGATVGMCLMATANHLLTVFLAVEMASVPSYALSGILKGRRQSSEAALKFAVFGAGAAGVMLYGISLVGGMLGSVHIPTAAARLADMMMGGAVQPTVTVLALGGLMIMVGLAFKLSAVPFQFWAPDVFEGAAAEIGGFLSVASKAAALALLIRLGIGLSYLPEDARAPTTVTATTASAQQAAVEPQPEKSERKVAARTASLRTEPARTAPFVLVAMQDASQAPVNDSAVDPSPVEAPPVEPLGSEPAETAPQAAASPDASQAGSSNTASSNPAPSEASAGTAAATTNPKNRQEALEIVRWFVATLIAVLAVATATFGNLAAYRQENIKRLLGYSTIAQAGYMMMPAAAAMALAGRSNQDDATWAVGTLGFYIVMYLFMNLTAFLIVALIRNQTGSESISAYRGLMRRSPGVAICFGLVLLSLIGIPPLVGFAGKFAIFSSLADAGMIVVLMIGALNTVISLFYYMRVIRVMTFEEPVDTRPVELPVFTSINGLFVLALTLPLLIFGVFWEPVLNWAVSSARSLLY